MTEHNNILEKKPWTNIHEKNYTWLYNYMTSKYKNVDEFTFIDDYKRQLYKIINDNDNWQDGSKEALYYMIARYLYNFGHELTKKIQEKETLNQQDEQEIENYRPHDYFIDIINLLSI